MKNVKDFLSSFLKKLTLLNKIELAGLVIAIIGLTISFISLPQIQSLFFKDPREELSDLNISFDNESFRKAIIDKDHNVVRLFIKSGKNLNNSKVPCGIYGDKCSLFADIIENFDPEISLLFIAQNEKIDASTCESVATKNIDLLKNNTDALKFVSSVCPLDEIKKSISESVSRLKEDISSSLTRYKELGWTCSDDLNAPICSYGGRNGDPMGMQASVEQVAVLSQLNNLLH